MKEKTEKAFRASKEDLSVAVRDEYGVAYSQDGKSLLKCENRELTEYVVREGTEVICNGAFSSCATLMNVRMPVRGVIAIGEDAFHLCKALETVNIPLTVTSVGEYAFAECYSLKKIYMPDKVGLTLIDEHTFLNCESLESVYLPKGVTYVKEGAFSGCISLHSIEVEATVPPKIDDPDLFAGVNFDNCMLYLPEGLVEAYANAPVWKNFTHVMEVE